MMSPSCLRPAAIAVLLIGTGAACAAPIEFKIDKVFSSSQAVGHVTVLLEQAGSHVNMTVTSHLAAGEFMAELYMNYDPFVPLTLSNPTVAAGSFALPNAQMGENAFQADGNGRFDILFNFSTGASGRFNANDKFTVTFDNATLAHFDTFSTSTGGHGPFKIAAHFQGLANGQSGWHYGEARIIPLPTAAWMAAVPLGLIVARRRRN